jgi:hypothetical protein
VETRPCTAATVEPGICAVAIGGLPRPATVLFATSMNGNHVDPPIKAMRVDSPAAPGAR